MQNDAVWLLIKEVLKMDYTYINVYPGQ